MYYKATEATDDNIIWRLQFACWISEVTNTHSEYVIVIIFPRQQQLRERTSLLRCAYIACSVLIPKERVF